MRSSLYLIAALSVCFAPVFSTSHKYDLDPKNWKPEDVITRDVAIVGGGSSGTYSALSLKDKGKSIIVIEKKARMGGHTETYIDPATDKPLDMGVIIFHNITVVRNYFKRMGVEIIAFGSDADPNAPAEKAANYDATTGKEVNVKIFSEDEVSAAFKKYAEILDKYPKLDDGMFLPDPVPEDLVMPFGEFVKKHDIEAVLDTMFNYNPGLGDILTGPTVEQMRVFGKTLVNSLSTGFLTTKHHNNSEVYTKATSELLSTNSLLLSSEVVHTSRTDNEVKLLVRTPTGPKLILSKKLLISIPPKPPNLHPFSLLPTETRIFSTLLNAGYYTSILSHTGIPDTTRIINYSPSTPHNFPVLPAIYSVSPTGAPGLHFAYYGSLLGNETYPLEDEFVKSEIIKAVKTMQAAHPDMFNASEPEFVEYSSHAPFYAQFGAEDTRRGMYGELYGLQGLRSTFWTGAAFRAQDSSLCWRFSEEVVLPMLLEGL
ncbi:amine oxidase, flavin-containing superfamily [Polyplosphaeria fusca]|uniref:Amine oxidase, flavin-containing superfamily n=1 Tax=Polyplosphaeria fusca TaxID=682080 RepID=A0A9P4QZB9_9PLEO|nr:amine oxidase, flavin-containing superfamily [Polyplosphaeria fusca]